MSPGLAGLPLAAPPGSAEVACWDLEPTVTAARTLRHEVLERWGDERPEGAQPLTMHRLALVLTELVTNAVQHGQGLIDVTLGRTTAGWLVVVSESPAPAERPAAAPTPWRRTDLDARQTGGRGLSIVLAISSRCGWARRDGELTVWAEVPVATTALDGVAAAL